MRRILFRMSIVSLALLLFLPQIVLACVGARPLGMGAAYVARGDANSVYWNPAGLTRLKRRSVQATYTLNNREYYNYDLFLSYVEPDYGTGAGGLSVITIRDIDSIDAATGEKLYDYQRWYVYSMGYSLGEALSAGVNLRYEKYGSDLDADQTYWGTRWAADLGVQAYLADWLTLGLLLQDIVGTDIRYNDFSVEGPGLNVRPGLSIQPDEHTTIAFDLYDLLDSFGAREYRVGIERWFADTVALRAGYNAGLTQDYSAWTAGASWQQDNWSIDYAFLGGDLGNTHQLGVEVSF